MIYYLTGVERENEITVDFSGTVGYVTNNYVIYTKGASFTGYLPLVSTRYSLALLGSQLVLTVNFANGSFNLPLTVPNNSFLDFSGYVKLTFITQEIVYFEETGYVYYDEVGEIDYPIPVRMNIAEKIKDNVIIEAKLNNLTDYRVVSSNQIINSYVATIVHAACSVVASYSAGYNANDNISNELTLQTKHNGVHFYPNNLYDSETVTTSSGGISITQSAQINSSNGLKLTAGLQVSGTVPGEEEDFSSGCNFRGQHEPLKKATLKLKAYNLDKPNLDDIPVSIFGDNFTFKSEANKTYEQIYSYSYNYSLIRKSGQFYYKNPTYDVAKINSPYRFLFRTFLYDAITSLTLSNEKNVGDILNENNWQVIKDARVSVDNNDVQIIVYFEGGRLFPRSENPNYSVVRYIPNNYDYFYLDSYRYLRLKLKAFLSTTVNLRIKINNKVYELNATDLDFYNEKIFYIDLCNPSNATQSIDGKNNNFDEDDSYADYWGVTKTRWIDIEFNYSFVLHSLDLCKNRHDINGGEERITFLPQRSTWQNNKRRCVVARFYGKQNLELADADLIDGNLTINQILDEINSQRWYGWQCQKANYDLSGCSGTFQNLRPCLLNLYTPATFLAGGGNIYDGTKDENFVNRKFSDITQVKAQFLVDEITFYPDCGDVFFGSTNSGAIILYASLIKRAQANGLIFVENEQVQMYNNNHYAGNDDSDRYGYYYITGDYAKSDTYDVIYQIPYTLRCFDANEYRVCFKPVLSQAKIINDIDYENFLFAATVNLLDENSFVFLFDNNFDNFYKKKTNCSSCELDRALILTAGRNLLSHSYTLNEETKLVEIGNYMYPFVKTYNNEIYISYYNSNDKNFIFEIYDSKYNLKKRFVNVIKTVPSGGEILEQNFPFDITNGLIVGIFVYSLGSNKYIQVVHSINGEEWFKDMEKQI